MQSNEKTLDALLEQSILDLLQRIPEHWQALSDEALSALEEKAAKRLTAAGMVEWRFSGRLSLIGHAVRIEFTATATGQHGLAEAMDPVLAKGWDAWEDFYRQRRDGLQESRPQFFCEKTAPQVWRLADQGVLARRDLAEGNSKVVLDFVLDRTAVFLGKVVAGHGRAERVETTSEEAAPTQVEVTNLAEVSGPLKDMAVALESAMERMAAMGQSAPAAAKGTDTGKRAKPGPRRMSGEDA